MTLHQQSPSCVGIQITPLDQPVGLRLEGEIDLSNCGALQGALSSLVGAEGDVHLELDALAFIDVGGARVLVNATRELGPGRRLVLHDPPHHLMRMLEVAWGAVPGLEVTRR